MEFQRNVKEWQIFPEKKQQISSLPVPMELQCFSHWGKRNPGRKLTELDEQNQNLCFFPAKQKQLLTNSKLLLKIFVSLLNLNLVSVCQFESFFCFCMNISYILKTKQKISVRIYTKLHFKSCLLIDKCDIKYHYWPHNCEQVLISLYMCSMI